MNSGQRFYGCRSDLTLVAATLSILRSAKRKGSNNPKFCLDEDFLPVSFSTSVTNTTLFETFIPKLLAFGNQSIRSVRKHLQPRFYHTIIIYFIINLSVVNWLASRPLFMGSRVRILTRALGFRTTFLLIKRFHSHLRYNFLD